jgi:hypothetical protein
MEYFYDDSYKFKRLADKTTEVDPMCVINTDWLLGAKGVEKITPVYFTIDTPTSTLPWRFLYYFSPELVYHLNEVNGGDTLADFREKNWDDICNRFNTQLEYFEYRITINAYTSIMAMSDALRVSMFDHKRSDIFNNLISDSSTKIITVKKEQFIAVKTGNTFKAADFGDIELPSDSLVESVTPLESNKVKIVLKKFHAPRYLKRSSHIFLIERDDLNNIGFQSMHMTFNDTAFPDVYSYSDRDCKTLARHPNIGGTGKVCLGDMKKHHANPTIKDFLKMMEMMNFDSAYFGRSELNKIFRKAGAETDWFKLPGLKQLTGRGIQL